MSDYRVNVTLTNETEGHRIYEESTDPDEFYWDAFKDDGTIDFGRLYREMREEYGRCQSSVYVDATGSGRKRVGWFFVKREQYTDVDETYLRGAWVTVDHVIEPAKVETRERVSVGR